MQSTPFSKTLVIGGANLDLTGNCQSRLIPGDSNPGFVKSCAGGVGRNIAENLARLGVPVQLMSALGDDLGAKVILESCDASNINAKYCVQFPEESTGTYLAINNQLGALIAAIADMAIIDKLTPSVLAQKQSVIDSCEQLVFDANLPASSIAWLAKTYAYKSVFVDAVSAAKAPRLSNILANIHTLKVNRDEAAAILNKTGDDTQLAKWLHQAGVRTVVLSQGPQGALVFNHQGVHHRCAIKGHNISDTGAGDALFAGFIAARQLLSSTASQLEFAIACGTETLNSPSSVSRKLTVNHIRQTYLTHIPEHEWQP